MVAEHIQDHVQVKVCPLGRSRQLGDIPEPQWIGLGGQQLRLGVGRMLSLKAPFPRFALGLKDAIHGSHGAQVNAFIQQGSMDPARGLITESFGMQQVQHPLTIALRERVFRFRSLFRSDPILLGRLKAIERRPRDSQTPTRARKRPPTPSNPTWRWTRSSRVGARPSSSPMTIWAESRRWGDPAEPRSRPPRPFNATKMGKS